LKDLGIDGRIILKCILNKQGGRAWADSFGSKQANFQPSMVVMSIYYKEAYKSFAIKLITEQINQHLES
jgi:hypothetical protein